MKMPLNPVARDRASLEAVMLESGGTAPDCALPVVIVREAIDGPRAGRIGEAQIRELFRWNGWRGFWADTIHDFDHYHSTHEALAIAHGQAVMLLGGEGGREVELHEGDLLVLPAGTVHRRLSASHDFLACGAYPPDHEADLLRPEAGPDRDKVQASVPLPDFDPFYGEHGPVTRIWSKGCRPRLH